MSNTISEPIARLLDGRLRKRVIHLGAHMNADASPRIAPEMDA